MLSGWPEGITARNESARTIGLFLLHEVFCRWGVIPKILTDNGSAFKAAIAWLKEHYGIKGIAISPYNHRANGKVEHMHWDTRQGLYKLSRGNPLQWFYFYPLIKWADRMTVRKVTGCSPFYFVTGAHPVFPLDIVEATWLVEPPKKPLSRDELLAYRATALMKHQDYVLELCGKIIEKKKRRVLEMERNFKNSIKDYKFDPGDLVLIRSTEIESSLNWG